MADSAQAAMDQAMADARQYMDQGTGRPAPSSQEWRDHTGNHELVPPEPGGEAA